MSNRPGRNNPPVIRRHGMGTGTGFQMPAIDFSAQIKMLEEQRDRIVKQLNEQIQRLRDQEKAMHKLPGSGIVTEE